MMQSIPLITGQRISADQMGFCSVHEHIVPSAYPDEKREEIIRYAVERLNKAYDHGVRTIVEVSPTANIQLLKEIVSQTPVQIIGCTGFYVGHNGIYDHMTTQDFLAHMLQEVEYGIQKSGIKPGVIKAATARSQPEGWEERLLTAAGMAQKATGLPLCVHSVTGVQHQQRLLADAGTDLSKVYFSHVEANQGWEGRSFEQEVLLLEKVMEKGSFLSFNNFGNWTHTPEDCMANLIQRFIRDGFGNRLLATMDFIWSYKEGVPFVLWEDICEDGAQRDYGYLVSHVIPWMRNNEVEENQIIAMNFSNPAELFS